LLACSDALLYFSDLKKKQKKHLALEGANLLPLCPLLTTRSHTTVQQKQQQRQAQVHDMPGAFNLPKLWSFPTLLIVYADALQLCSRIRGRTV